MAKRSKHLWVLAKGPDDVGESTSDPPKVIFIRPACADPKEWYGVPNQTKLHVDIGCCVTATCLDCKASWEYIEWQIEKTPTQQK